MKEGMYRILSARCERCGKKTCGELATIVACGWAVRDGHAVCPECLSKERREKNGR